MEFYVLYGSLSSRCLQILREGSVVCLVEKRNRVGYDVILCKFFVGIHIIIRYNWHVLGTKFGFIPCDCRAAVRVILYPWLFLF